MPVNLLADNYEDKDNGRVNLLADDHEEDKQQSNLFDAGKLANAFSNQVGGQDVLRNILVGLGQGGQNIASFLTHGYAPKVNMEEYLHANKEFPGRETIRESAEYAPLGEIAPVVGSKLAKFGKKIASTIYPRMPENEIASIKNLPEEISRSITNYLGKGAEKVTDVEKKIGKNIYSSAKKQKDLAINEYLNPLLDKFGKDIPFTKRILPKELESKTSNTSLYDTPKLKLPYTNNKVNAMYKQFKNSPTISNMQKLQSTLMREANSLKNSGNFGMAENNQYDVMMDYRNKILDKMDEHFSNSGKNYSDQFKAFRQVYKKEYEEPYKQRKKIRDISSGKITVPENPHTIFKRPGQIINYEGKEVTSPINTIREHLPKDIGDLVLFSKVGGHQKAKDLYKNLISANSKGYEEYFSPELKAYVQKLGESLSKRESLAELLKKEASVRRRVHIGAASAAGLAGVGAVAKPIKKLLSE
jgi:hypothetical protein